MTIPSGGLNPPTTRSEHVSTRKNLESIAHPASAIFSSMNRTIGDVFVAMSCSSRSHLSGVILCSFLHHRRRTLRKNVFLGKRDARAFVLAFALAVVALAAALAVALAVNHPSITRRFLDLDLDLDLGVGD